MTIKQIIDLISADGSKWLLILFVVASIVQISPIKLNPWTALVNWLGKALNKPVIEKVEHVDKKIDEVDKKLNTHIAESENQILQTTRSEILSFGSSIISGKNYNKEKFDFMISKCDMYEKYCRENNVANGVADATIREIRRIYGLRLSDGSFLKEGHVYDEEG